MIRSTLAALSVAALLLPAATADAGRVDLDINGVRMTADSPIDEHFTGRIALAPLAPPMNVPPGTPQTLLTAASVGGQNRLTRDIPASLDGELIFEGGRLIGGDLHLWVVFDQILDGRVRPGSGRIVRGVGDRSSFQFGGTMTGSIDDWNGDGLFTDLGVPAYRGPLEFLVLDFEPDAQGHDIADIEIRTVPVPAAGPLGTPLALALLALRRR